MASRRHAGRRCCRSCSAVIDDFDIAHAVPHGLTGADVSYLIIGGVTVFAIGALRIYQQDDVLRLRYRAARIRRHHRQRAEVGREPSCSAARRYGCGAGLPSSTAAASMITPGAGKPARRKRPRTRCW